MTRPVEWVPGTGRVLHHVHISVRASRLTAAEIGEVLEMGDLAEGVHPEAGACVACARLDATITELRRIRGRWTEAHAAASRAARPCGPANYRQTEPGSGVCVCGHDFDAHFGEGAR